MYHSYQHAFHWPTPAATAIPEAAAAAAAAAGPAAAHFTPHPGMMYHHHHPFRFRRFGLFRRFFWFGAGAAVATWYYNKQQRIAAAQASYPSGVNEMQDGPAGWHRTWHARHDHRQLQQQQQQQQQQQAPLIDHASAPMSMPAQPSIPTSFPIPSPAPAVIPTATAQMDSEHPASLPAENEPRQWGWRARRMKEVRDRQREEAARASSASQIQIQGVNTVESARTPVSAQQGQDEMARIREAVDRLYAEKMRDVKSMQEQANDKAKEYAREKLDQLSSALETLRQSLQKEENIKTAAIEKKLV